MPPAKDTGKVKADESTKAPEAVDGSDPLGTDKGYIGQRVDPRDDSEHSLESGPDAPTALDQAKDAKAREVAALEASNA